MGLAHGKHPRFECPETMKLSNDVARLPGSTLPECVPCESAKRALPPHLLRSGFATLSSLKSRLSVSAPLAGRRTASSCPQMRPSFPSCSSSLQVFSVPAVVWGTRLMICDCSLKQQACHWNVPIISLKGRALREEPTEGRSTYAKSLSGLTTPARTKP